ncbi:Imm40 family immunity protein [Herpetosiphon llansteffanensis]|uniref:Imm40 family immunity protein n=1 Tax=Herpetosiphon llansteffanensis TaxID=2094568 RepID=UPI0013DF4154|nr:Imm40 family immunity protein [Herpetosiphon llansteffanensis]
MQPPELSWSFGEHVEHMPTLSMFYHHQNSLYALFQGPLNQLVVWVDDAACLQLNFNQPSIMPHLIKRLGEYLVLVPLLDRGNWQAQFGLNSMTLNDYVNLKVSAIVIAAAQWTELWHSIGQTDDYLATLEPISSTELAWLWLLSSQIPPAEQSPQTFAGYAKHISSAIVAQEPETTPAIGEFIQALLAGKQAFSQTPIRLQNLDGQQITGYWLDQQQQVHGWNALWQRHEQPFFLLAGLAIAALNPYASLLQAKGTPLNDLMINEIGLQRADALHAIELIRAMQKPILGGDIYRQTNDQIDPTYDNWSIDAGPSHSVDAQRSCDISRSYIERYPNPHNQMLLFVFVLSKK